MPVLTPRRIALAAVIAWLVIGVISIATGPPLGHDEAAFATAARGGAPAWLYRSSGMIWLAHVGVALGGSEIALRLASLLLGPTIVLAAWRVGAAAFDERTGAWAAAIVATAHPMTLHAADLIGDLPATAAILGGLAVLVRELSREGGPRWRLVLVAPAFAAGFYLRYGCAPVIASAAVAAGVVWPRAIVRAPQIVGATAGLFVALLVPHALSSIHATGSLLGILEASAAVPRSAYIGEGLVTYVTTDPFYFYGALVAPLAVLGLYGVIRRPTRASLFLVFVALAQIVAIGLKSHAQPRYVFIATTLLVVLGVDQALRLLADRPRLARAGAVVVAVAWLGAAAVMVPYNRWLANERAALRAAADAIDRDDASARCLVACRVVTQLMWYTGCDSFLLRDLSQLPAWPTDVRRYVVSVPHGTTAIAPIAAAEHATPVAVPTAHPRAQVWRLDEPAR